MYGMARDIGDGRSDRGRFAVQNVILLTVDALRADHLPLHGYGRRTAPFLTAFAEDRTWFEKAYSASSHTREALPAILTGKYPDSAVGDAWELGGTSLATMLGEQSLRTGAFHSNPYASRAYGFEQGFDTFDDDLYLGDSRLLSLLQRGIQKLRNKHYARAEVINERSLSWVDEGGSPFFLWNHYMDVHGPYEPPGDYRTEYATERVSDEECRDLYRRAVDRPETIAADERETLKALYDAEIRYLDDRLAEFVAALEDRDLLTDSLVVLSADHGEAFGEHGYYAHPRQLHDEMVHVPMVLSADNRGAVGAPASTIDIVPTALDALGHDVDRFEGRSLLEVGKTPDGDSRVVFSQSRRHDDPRKVRFAARNRESVSFLEVDTGDGSEVSASGDALIERLREHANGRLADEAFDAGGDGTSKTVEDRLDALGYR